MKRKSKSISGSPESQERGFMPGVAIKKREASKDKEKLKAVGMAQALTESFASSALTPPKVEKNIAASNRDRKIRYGKGVVQ